MIVGKEGGTQIRISSTDIDLGGGATEQATSAKKVFDALDAVFQAWAPVAGDGGAALKAAWNAAKAAVPSTQTKMSTLITKVK